MQADMRLVPILLLAIIFTMPIASAQSLGVKTVKSTYNYGDYLSIEIIVPKVTAKSAIMYITDSQGVKSTAIPVPIKNQTTTITAPNSFNAEIFKPGTYQIQIDYGNATSSVSFKLINDGRSVLPYGSTAVIPNWVGGSISDQFFFKFLVEKNIIKSSDKPSEKTVIPYWYKATAKLWLDKKISDSEFIKGLQYLVDKKIIKP